MLSAKDSESLIKTNISTELQRITNINWTVGTQPTLTAIVCHDSENLLDAIIDHFQPSVVVTKVRSANGRWRLQIDSINLEVLKKFSSIKDNFKEINYVYISQGRNGRLTNESEVLGVKGLYTDNFTTCVILACSSFESSSSHKAILLHIDTNSLLNFDQVTDEINWVKEKNVVLFHKKAGKQTADVVISELKKRSFDPTVIPVDDAFHNVSIAVLNGKHSLKVLPEDKKPENIFYHQEERKCISVRAIEQIVGKLAFFEERFISIKRQLSFNGTAWLSFSDEELQIDESHELTKAEMDILRREKTNFHTLLQAICEQITSSAKKWTDEQRLMKLSYVTSCLEDYLNNYNLDNYKNFKENILEAIKKLKKLESSADNDDILVKNKLSALLGANSDDKNMNLISMLLNEYLNKNDKENSYKALFSLYCGTFLKHYNRRLFYHNLSIKGVFMPVRENKNKQDLSSITETETQVAADKIPPGKLLVSEASRVNFWEDDTSSLMSSTSTVTHPMTTF